ncbi:hypothetical protein XENTR_v10002725 [Xenopus tropicalis]|uniref:Glutaredoxin-1 n=1 Tax=Xenopus tropicalis TaxID=8364 RepID=A0A6I8SU32_XENTR|nr:hypothetical protein XENTR_v10002725 [Xenopus tropicalis]
MAQSFVQSKLKPSKVTMFEKPTCPFCVRAKGVLTKYNFKDGHLEIIDICKLDFMSSLQQYFKQSTGESTILLKENLMKATGPCGCSAEKAAVHELIAQALLILAFILQ